MIYDCFLYYDEDMLLDIRLHTLADVVDRFVIVEATHSFTGIPRELHFDISNTPPIISPVVVTGENNY